MVILERGASKSNIERYFITFFDTVNNESRGVNIFPEANLCSKPTLNIAFRGRNRVARLKKSCTELSTLTKSSKSPGVSSLSMISTSLFWLAWPEELGEVLLACVPKPVSNLYPPRIFYSRRSNALFYRIGNTCPIEKSIDDCEKLEQHISVPFQNKRETNINKQKKKENNSSATTVE